MNEPGEPAAGITSVEEVLQKLKNAETANEILEISLKAVNEDKDALRSERDSVLSANARLWAENTELAKRLQGKSEDISASRDLLQKYARAAMIIESEIERNMPTGDRTRQRIEELLQEIE